MLFSFWWFCRRLIDYPRNASQSRMGGRRELQRGWHPGSRSRGYRREQRIRAETFVEGKARNMHADKRAEKITGTGGKDKAMVLGILERSKDGNPSPTTMRAKVVANRRKKALQAEVLEHVQAGSAIYRFA
jgi:hypothetical protein